MMRRSDGTSRKILMRRRYVARSAMMRGYIGDFMGWNKMANRKRCSESNMYG